MPLSPKDGLRKFRLRGAHQRLRSSSTLRPNEDDAVSACNFDVSESDSGTEDDDPVSLTSSVASKSILEAKPSSSSSVKDSLFTSKKAFATLDNGGWSSLSPPSGTRSKNNSNAVNNSLFTSKKVPATLDEDGWSSPPRSVGKKSNNDSNGTISPGEMDQQGQKAHMDCTISKPDPTETDGDNNGTDSLLLRKNGSAALLTAPPGSKRSLAVGDEDGQAKPDFAQPVRRPLTVSRRERSTLVAVARPISPVESHTSNETDTEPPQSKAIQSILPLVAHGDFGDDQTTEREESHSSFHDEPESVHSVNMPLSPPSSYNDGMSKDDSNSSFRDDPPNLQQQPLRGRDRTPRRTRPPLSHPSDIERSQHDDNDSSNIAGIDSNAHNSALDHLSDIEPISDENLHPVIDPAEYQADRDNDVSDNNDDYEPEHAVPPQTFSNEEIGDLVENLFIPEETVRASPPPKVKRKKKAVMAENPWANPWMPADDELSPPTTTAVAAEAADPVEATQEMYPELSPPTLPRAPVDAIFYSRVDAASDSTPSMYFTDFKKKDPLLSPTTSPRRGLFETEENNLRHSIPSSEASDQVDNFSSSLVDQPPAPPSRKTLHNSPPSSPIAQSARGYVPPPCPMMHQSPYNYSKRANDDDSSSIDKSPKYDPTADPLYDESSRASRSSLRSSKKYALPPEHPIVMASIDDPTDCTDNSRLTEAFEDEASLDFRALMGIEPTSADNDGTDDIGIDPFPSTPTEETEKPPSMSDLGSSKSGKNEYISRKTILVASGLACTLICLAAIAGGVLGAFVFGDRGKTEEVINIVYTTNPPTAPANATTPEVPSDAGTFAPTATVLATVPAAPSTTAAPPEVPPTTAPMLPPTTSPTDLSPTSTPTSPPTRAATSFPSLVVTNQELFDTIADASFDGGASILLPDSPQQRAFTWLQDFDILTNADRRRKLQGGNRLRGLALSKERIVQRYALASLYFATNGPKWFRKDDWLNPLVNECNWFTDSDTGSGCSLFVKQIRILQFQINNLIGTLPPEVALLTTLRRINIIGGAEGGQLTGGIPSEVGLLTNLEFLKLRGHNLTQDLPGSLFEKLESLVTLDLSLNNLPGQIPSSIVNLTKVENVILRDNELTGDLPEGIAASESLAALELQNNLLDGPLPTEVANLTLIELFDVSNNNFTGPPPDFSGWSKAIDTLDLSDNSFSGQLPDIFGSLGGLKRFRARNNLLSGEIPPSLSALQSVEEIDIRGNNLEGNITEAMCATFNAVGSAVLVDCQNISCACCSEC